MNTTINIPETDQDWQDAITRQQAAEVEAETESTISTLIWERESARTRLLHAQYEAWQMRNALAGAYRERDTLRAERATTPPPAAPVGVKPTGITSLADIVRLDEGVDMSPAPPRNPVAAFNRNPHGWGRHKKPPTLEAMDMRGKSWEDQVAAIRLYRETYPDAPMTSIAKALRLKDSIVHYVITGERYPSEMKAGITYPSLPPVLPQAPKPRMTPLPEPPRPARPTAAQLGIPLDLDSMVIRTT